MTEGSAAIAELDSLRALLAAREVELAAKDAELRSRDLLIEKLRHQLAGLRRHRFGARSESLDQLELTLEEVEIVQALEAPAEPAPVAESEKRKPKRLPLPDHLPRCETVLPAVAGGGEACPACGGRLKRVGEDVTEELEYVPARFVVNRIVRPRMACACCEAFHQAALPSRPIERGRPGPGLLSHVLVSKYADHLPLYRQAQIFARNGLGLDRSTLADWVGQSTALLAPLAEAIGRHVLAGRAIFADNTPVRLQAPGTGRTHTARLWTYVRDERSWAGEAPAAAWYRFTCDRKGEHPAAHPADYQGWMHADGYAGFEELYRSGDVREVACMAHVRRKFVDVHQSQGSAIAAEALERIVALCAIEAEARGRPPDERKRIRQARAGPIFDGLGTWLAAQGSAISAKTPLAGAIRYALSRLQRLRPHLDDGTLKIDNNTAERAMRGVALGCKNWLFAGSPAGGRAAAVAYTLIETAKLNGTDLQAGSPTSSPASPTTRSPSSTTSCPGTQLSGTDHRRDGQTGRLPEH